MAAEACAVVPVVVVVVLVGMALADMVQVVDMVSVVVVVAVHVLFHGVRLVIVVTQLTSPFVAATRWVVAAIVR